MVNADNGRVSIKLLRKAFVIFDSVTGLLAFLAAILLIFIMLAIGLEIVVMLFGRSLRWVPQVCEYSLLGITFLATAWLLKREGHVKIDMLVTRLNPRPQALLNIITSILGVIMCLVVTYYGVQVTRDAFQIGYYWSGEALLTPKWSVMLVIPVGSFLLSIQFVRRAYSYVGSWRMLDDKQGR